MNTNIRHFNRVKLLLKLADTFRRALDYQKDPNPEHWGTIKGAHVHKDENGNIDGGAGGALNGRPIKKPTKNENNGGQPEGNGYNEHVVVTAKGGHKFPEALFVNKQKFRNHLRDHSDDLKKAGIRTEADYRRETRRVIESPVGGDILGHIANKKNNQIVRYDKRINLFVKGNPDRGVFTSFVPDGEPRLYYESMKKGDLAHNGED